MNAALNQNQAELSILVLAVPVQVLADGHCLLDEVVHILRQGGCQAIRLQDAQDVVACDSLDLRDAEAISQCHANLRRGEALLGKLADVIAHILWLHLQPSRRRSLVGDGRGGYALALAIHAPHLGADSCGYSGPLHLAAACATLPSQETNIWRFSKIRGPLGVPENRHCCMGVRTANFGDSHVS